MPNRAADSARQVDDTEDDIDARARRTLIEKHLELARNIAGRLARSYQTMLAPEDIEALARLGLCEAASRFDPRRAEPFLAFAERRIRGAVMDEVRRLGAHTRGGRIRRRLITETRRKLERTHGESGDAAVAEHLQISPEEVARALAPTRVVFAPLEAEACESSGPRPDEAAEDAQALEQVARAKQALPPLDQVIIEMYYDRELSFSAIAKELGISVGRTMSVHARALEQLRRDLVERCEVGVRAHRASSLRPI